MHGSRQFHIDIGDHSVTLNLGPGRAGWAELLVDGKVIGYVRERASRTTLVEGELAGDPVRPFTLRIRQPVPGIGTPECTVLIDGDELRMPRRSSPRARRRGQMA
ncbi:hypothetical protein I3F58_19505 [Streptomyces sp. MUM 203J]|uniref:hypothetical protein n=1 Tax=Streptomyces sp. MUM 203J TaxID=2791990 RepID=UPI001F04F35B|nr:hypothetical protein [Streptomyces sp. MUM 203J]MCH0541712.1 hypothetical protein [Streptomyces sp. MUM 203J]